MLKCQKLLAFNIHEQNKFHTQLSWAWKCFITSRSDDVTKLTNERLCPGHLCPRVFCQLTINIDSLSIQVIGYVVSWKLKSVTASSFLQTNIFLIRVDCSRKLFWRIRPGVFKYCKICRCAFFSLCESIRLSISSYTPIPHRPRISRIATNWFFFLFGGFVRCHYFFSPIVMFYESVTIQIRCRYEYSGESAQFGCNRANMHES